MGKGEATPAYGVVITDFDGTAIINDIPLLILKEFGMPGWEAFDRRLESGEISLEDSLRTQYAMIRARSESEILRYARRHYEIREGFTGLAELCQQKGTKLVVVSAGLDFCIEDVVKQFGLRVDRLVCPESQFTREGIKVEFPCFRSPSRNFKEAVVAGYRRKGVRSIYVGDGYSDFYAATCADVVFAVTGSVLERECRKNGVGFTPLSSFGQLHGLLT